MTNHPDRGGDEAQIANIKSLKHTIVLSNSDKRDAYDHPHQANPFSGRQQGQQNPFGRHAIRTSCLDQGFGQRQRHTPRNIEILHLQADISV